MSGITQGEQLRNRAARGLWFALRTLLAMLPLLLPLAPSPARAEVTIPDMQSLEGITIAADSAQRWTQGVYDVLVLDGHCYLNQGQTYARSKQAVLWIEKGNLEREEPHKVIAYLEGDVSIDFAPSFDKANKPTGKSQARIEDQQWIGRFYSRSAPDVRIKITTGEPNPKPPIFLRADAMRMGKPAPIQNDATRRGKPASIQKAQFAAPIDESTTIGPRDPFERPGQPAVLGTPGAEPVEALPPVGTRRVRVFPRSDVPVQAQWFPSPNRPGEWIAIVSSGVNLIVDGLDGFGSIDVSTDRLVLWTQSQQAPDLTGATLQDQNTPFEIYLEGNIVFR